MVWAGDNVNILPSAISRFSCDLDNDINNFLQEKAIDFLNRKLCSTYLLLNEEEFHQGKLKIEAYFTLSHKAMLVPSNISKTIIQEISGFKNKSIIQFVLIGQLGKFIKENADGTCEKSQIQLNQILDSAFEVMNEASDIIPVRCVLIECNDFIRTKQIYDKYGFKYIGMDKNLHQYFKKL